MVFLYVVVALVLIFDFLNGFHDSANSIATVVSTKVLSPIIAVILAAFFNFIAFTIFPMNVAHTIGNGVVNPDVINLTVFAAALVAAITWNILTWWWGLPSSSSHTLVGGLVGAAIAHSGVSRICRAYKNYPIYFYCSYSWNVNVLYNFFNCCLSL
jgi:PiT family inorganic phosphate transporter